jgi:hypothetical protein
MKEEASVVVHMYNPSAPPGVGGRLSWLHIETLSQEQK